MKRIMRKWKIMPLIVLLLIPLFPIYAESPNISASGAIVMDVTTGRILYEKNIHEKKPMASTTKIMTALVALEESDLNEMITVPRSAVGVEGSSIYLEHDEKVKMKDLLYGLMLRSGNDSAVAIATHIGGNIEKFADMMNRKAKSIGALNTNFKNPHGLHHKEHYTTAYDLALITREALKNEDFKQIVRTKLWVAEREGVKYFYNKNKTLLELEGGDGVKTGFTKASGRCLVTSATRDGMQLISVVLNAPNWFEDSYHLLNYSFEQYQSYKVIEKDKVLKTVPVKDGKKSETGIISFEDVVIPLKEQEIAKLVTIFETNDNISAPVSRGSIVGKAKIYVDNQLLHSINLVYREDIEAKTLKDRIIDLLPKKLSK